MNDIVVICAYPNTKYRLDRLEKCIEIIKLFKYDFKIDLTVFVNDKSSIDLGLSSSFVSFFFEILIRFLSIVFQHDTIR